MSSENNINYLVIALPSGKLFKLAIQLFEGIGIDLKGGREISRKLAFFDQDKKIKFIITRPKDNPTYVDGGSLDECTKFLNKGVGCHHIHGDRLQCCRLFDSTGCDKTNRRQQDQSLHQPCTNLCHGIRSFCTRRPNNHCEYSCHRHHCICCLPQYC